MNIALLSLGSNDNREYNMFLCCRLLSEIYPEIIYSDTSITKPYGKRYKNDFINRLAIIYTKENKNNLIANFKLLEKKMGRTLDDKQKGIIAIDIDLVIWNKEIIKLEDMKRDYIKDLLPTLPSNKLPDFIVF